MSEAEDRDEDRDHQDESRDRDRGGAESRGGAGATEAEEGSAKPQSDEARSAFSPPSGVAAATARPTWTEPRAEDDPQVTSEFSLPEGFVPPEPPDADTSAATTSAFSLPHTYDARHAPPAFTPAEGVPILRLTKEAPWQDRMRTMLRMPVAERPTPESAQKHDAEEGPAVPRVLDLTLRIGELLLAGGEGAEDVEAAMFAVSRSYGLDRVEPNVTFTLLNISYQPSLVEDPVTAARTVRRRGTDYTRLSAVFQLVDDLTSPGTDVSLEEAYRRLAVIRRNRHPYPGWALTAANGLLAGSASVLVGGGPPVFFCAAIGAMLGDRLAWLAAGRGLPEFYQFLVAATPPAAIGVTLNLVHSDLRASAVITGGLFALLPGRALVAGVQDGLTGYYITAAARLLEVLYFFVGIVIGVLVVLYAGVQLHASLDPDVTGNTVNRPVAQLLASVALSLAFAVLLQQERSTVIPVALNGGVAWLVYGSMHFTGKISPVAATAVAAGLVGLFGQLLSRYQFASSLPYVTAAIGPLLPGSATYYGLLGIAQNDLDDGLLSLSRAVATALAIAIGVNLGSEISRLFLRVPGTIARKGAKRTRGF
ncbi:MULTISPECIES: threonine/serine exporter family protein [unclassified Streptomyces]|uniref:threonine/serine exporter family protein n=1 Tax=Streptomyces TaxID=1883 RepID=UPI001010F735|nr:MULTISPECIES: threonine/serine exporter family protein [unclassified Streptomyces]MDT0424413.1 threonine/serine exporter family protein [Streptomyces sp. DSM 41859]WEH28979.1 threonine/serine exporter family protein [Streptomyces sp. AM 3-1-1]